MNEDGVSWDASSLSPPLCILKSSLILGRRFAVSMNCLPVLVGRSASCRFRRRCLTDLMFVHISVLSRPPRRRRIDNYLRKQSFKRHSWWQLVMVSGSRLLRHCWLCDTNYHIIKSSIIIIIIRPVIISSKQQLSNTEPRMVFHERMEPL